MPLFFRSYFQTTVCFSVVLKWPWSSEEKVIANTLAGGWHVHVKGQGHSHLSAWALWSCLHLQGQWYCRYQMVSFFNCGPKRGLSWARIAISQLKFGGEEQEQKWWNWLEHNHFHTQWKNFSVLHSVLAFTAHCSWEMADQGTNPFFGDVITVLFPVTKSLPPSLFFSSPFVTPQLPFTFPSVQTLTGTAKIRFQPTRFVITIAINDKAFHGPPPHRTKWAFTSAPKSQAVSLLYTNYRGHTNRN